MMSKIKPNRQKACNREGTKQQEENKFKICSSTDEGMETREANTPIKLAEGHTMFKKATHHIYFLEGGMTVINPLMNRTGGTIEPRFLVASFPTTAPSAGASFSCFSAFTLNNYMLLGLRLRARQRKGWGVTR